MFFPYLTLIFKYLITFYKTINTNKSMVFRDQYRIAAIHLRYHIYVIKVCRRFYMRKSIISIEFKYKHIFVRRNVINLSHFSEKLQNFSQDSYTHLYYEHV